MGYSKDPSVYPPEFQELYRRALDEAVTIKLDNYQQATSLRHQLHAYRRAVELVKTPGWDSLRSIEIQMDKNVLTLKRSPIISKLREAIHKEPDEAELDAYLKRMESGDQDDS